MLALQSFQQYQKPSQKYEEEPGEMKLL